MLLWVLIAVMVLAWSGNFIIAKFTLRELPPFALLFLRVLFSNGLLLPLYLASRQHRRQPLERGDWKWFALLGLFGIALNQTGFTVGLHHTTVSHSSLIISLSPLLVLILASRMQLERFTRQKLAGMALSFAGVGVLTLEHGAGTRNPTFLGDLLTGMVVVAPLAGWELFEVNWAAVTWRGWLGVAYMAAMASVAAYMIFYYALSKISASRVIAFSYLQPVLATILAILFLGERITPYLLVGGALVLVGVALAERGRG